MMIAKKTLWYIGQRAEQLAFVYLSRRDDLIIANGSDSHGLDLIVNITGNGKFTGRMFGVQLKAYKTLEDVISERKKDCIEVKPGLKKARILKDIPFPMVMFLFGMDNDEGYYHWVNQKSLHEMINRNPESSCQTSFKKITNQNINCLVREINQWYDKKSVKATKS
ncbi:MAG: DUF4365 domain-containing protein [Gammaproteobacteria bacterium]|nr:DUF4365 domain-containing protein [Gammaproteobacteria bacterium]